MSQSKLVSKKDSSKVHKLALKGSSKVVSEFFEYSINTILCINRVSMPSCVLIDP